LDFRLLGPLEVADDRGSEIAVRSGQQRAVLALLLLRANELVPSERLVEELWGESPPPTANKMLQNQMSGLRRALGHDGRIEAERGAYRLRVCEGELDVDRFEQLLDRGRALAADNDPAAAAAAFRQALDLWRGEPLAEFAYEAFAQHEIARLEERRLVAFEERVGAELAVGRHADLVGELEAAVAAQPLRERLHAQLMIALYRCGRQAEALEAYRRARQTLVDEIGVEPGAELRSLHAAILAQDPALEPAVPAQRAAALEITLLGPPRVSRDGEPVAFDTRKATALLAHLALAERPRSREALCELLWPAYDPEHARGALRRTLSALRRSIGEEWIETIADSVALRAGDGLEIDVRRFRSLTADGASPQELGAAIHLFGGELLEGFSIRDSPEFEAWHIYEADLLRRELASALGRLVAVLREQGDLARAIPHARRWLELDPLHEPAHRELIRLYALNGDRAAALTQYRDCVRTLSEELGVAPVEETAALFEQVSEGAPAPSAPRPAAAASAPVRPSELPFVGRTDELAALVASWRAAIPDGRLAVIEGEPGIGKTRLGRELGASVAAQEGAMLAARCHDDEAGLPYGPMVDLLSEALRVAPDALGEAVPPQRLADASLLLPELASLHAEPPAPVSLSGPGAQARLLEGVAAVLAAACRGPAPGLVLVDDVHAADEATLDALGYLGRRLRSRPLLLVLGWRSEGIPPGHRLRRLVTELAREGTATVVRLARLDESDVAVLVEAVRPSVAPELVRRIYVESEGLPLFVAEYLAVLRAGGEPGDEPLPREMRGLLEARLGELGAMGRQLLETAAVMGRSFDLDSVRTASGRSVEETAEGLDELVGRGLVRELAGPEPAYDFTHEKLRTLVYEDVGKARRRLLHGRVADALSRSTRGPERAALLAQHLRLSGDLAGAAEQHRLAGEQAASLLAHADALEHFDAALALGHRDTAGLHERIGDLRTLVGDYTGALASYESAAAHGAAGAVARREHKLGGVYQRRGEWERAEARFAVALESLAPDEDGLRARILADLSLTLQQAGRSARAEELAEEALALAETAADDRAQAQAHNLLGVLARGAGRLEPARAELKQSLALAERLGDPAARAAALNNLALVARDAGEPARALELTERALALCTESGDRHREAALENNLADLHHAAGRSGESMEHLKRALAIFTEVGADEATRLPEIWKLVSW
jgi:DNA-binding SARP family transcriptional activator/predicted ATPase